MSLVQPPTSRLPPIAAIATFTTAQLSESLDYLHSLYRPQVRGSRRRRREPSDDDDGDDNKCLRADAFERAYTIRWLTALIAQLEARQEQSSLASADLAIHLPANTDCLVQHAASLLAACAGVAAAGKVHRRFSFRSILVGDVHISLTDIPLDNRDYGSVGSQTWGGACVLADMIAEHPGQFGLGPGIDTRDSLRILELGAGTGLVGLTVAKLLHALPSAKDQNRNRRATIVLTDSYPAVLDNLQSNIDSNFPPDNIDHAISVRSHPLDWSSFSTSATTPDILSTPFDVVFGADIIYEAPHAVWIRDCLGSLLSYPGDSSVVPLFHLVIPLRPTHTFESSAVEEVFGKARISEASQRELVILSKEHIVCDAHEDAEGRTGDDVEYVYYQIGWTR